MPHQEYTPRYTRACDIEERQIKWIWRGKLVAGAINLIMGMPDQGKTTLACDLAARMTCGEKFPGDPTSRDPKDVMFFSAEDDVATTIKPRLRVAGADLNRVVFPSIPNRGFDIASGAGVLDELFGEFPEMGMIVIDPLDSHLGRIDSRDGLAVRQALRPLRDFCERTGVAGLILHHPNKAQEGRAIDRVSGSRSFGAMPRSVLMLAKDENDPGRALLVPVKANLTKDRSGLAFRIEPAITDPEVPHILWLGDVVTASADELLGGASTRRVDEACDFLRDTLAGGEMLQRELEAQAGQRGICPRTLRRAKDSVGVQTRRRAVDGQSRWYWSLNSRTNNTDHLHTCGHLGHLGNVG